jgi:TPR repeat protein
MYANGHGVVQDYSQALKWYRFAADRKTSMGNIGVMYLQRRGVPRTMCVRTCGFMAPPGRS